MKYRRWPSYQAWRNAKRGDRTLTIRANEDMFSVAGTAFTIDGNGDVVSWVPPAFRRAFEPEPPR